MIVLSIYLKLTLGLLIAAFVVQLIALVAPYWNSGIWISYFLPYEYYNTNVGLWQTCTQARCFAHTVSGGAEATRAFEVIGFISLFAVTVLLLIYIFKDAKPILILICLVLSFVAAGFILSGIIIWVTEVYGTGFLWAFWFCILAGILGLLAGILLILERRYRSIIVGGGGDAVQTNSETTTITVSKS